MKTFILAVLLITLFACNNNRNPDSDIPVEVYKVPLHGTYSFWYTIQKNNVWYYSISADSLTDATEVTTWNQASKIPPTLQGAGVIQYPNDTVSVYDLPGSLQSALGY